MRQRLVKGDRIPYAQIANDVLNDKYLSLKAKGLYAYLYSKPDDWDFSGERMGLDSTDGKRAVYEGLKELERVGYLDRQRQPSGRMDYTIYASKQSQKPTAENSKEAKPQTAKTASISNKESLQTKKDIQTTPLPPKRGRKERVSSLMEMHNTIFESAWDATGSLDVILPKLQVSIKRGDEILSRGATLVADYLEDTRGDGWGTKADYLATMRECLRPLVNADVLTISRKAFCDALDRTSEYTSRPMSAVIKAL